MREIAGTGALACLSPRYICLAATVFALFACSYIDAATVQNTNNINTRRIMEPAFAGAGQTEGIEIWRIEDFKPVKYPKDQYGKFYAGDSYIILNTKKNKAGDLSWDIHFWLGLETSQDEAGAAAIYSVQLDDQLGGAPVQYREVQEHESQMFLSRFKNGVRYLPGGVSTGFHHVDPNAFEKKLFQVKGSRNIRVKQVDVTIASMNTGDCFILDNGPTIYVYVGSKSKRLERIKAIAAANQIRDQDHAGRSKVIIVDEFSPESEVQEYFTALGGGSRADVPEDTVGGDDQQFESSQEKIVTLYRVSDASGSLKVEQVAQKPLAQSMLDTNDCFILDTTDSNIFVWVGKGCNNREKSEAMAKAQNFLTTNKYPKWTQVQRIVQGAEPTSFTQYFRTWQAVGEQHARLVRAASQENQGFVARLFHVKMHPYTSKFSFEEIVDFEQDDLAEDDLMLLDIGKKLFVWVGKGTDELERSSAKSLGKTYLSKTHREDVPVILINQGQEPESFTEYFEKWNTSLWEKQLSYEAIKAQYHGK